MSGLVVQHISTSPSIFEVDDFSTIADCHVHEDREQIYDTGDLQVEEILNDESEGEEEIDEDVRGADDEYGDTDDDNSISSGSEDEENADAAESSELRDIAEIGDVCEFENDGSEDIVSQSSHCDKETFGYTLNNSGLYS